MTAKTITKRKAAKPTRKIFGEIASGLRDAISIAKGAADPNTYRAHVPDEIDVRAVRKKTGLTQEEFAVVYGFTADAVQDWEQHRRTPDRSTRAYLIVIEKNPLQVQKSLGSFVPKEFRNRARAHS
jgi:putative transcriptional regulator